jgi:hypothetical protein
VFRFEVEEGGLQTVRATHQFHNTPDEAMAAMAAAGVYDFTKCPPQPEF